ncbi:MAG: nucleotidyltransferase domain-containing protein [Gemmatimonadetes bacterium]|jgi:predicted nucleotidyltransferase|nr:nucleotidyltransferase domain-containing protein [Gemmatimonadota bacterium]
MKRTHPNLSGLAPADAAAVAMFTIRVRAVLADALVEMRLFGSKARGDATEESDIDVLVVVSRIHPEVGRQVSDAAFEASLEHDVLIAPVLVSRARYQDAVWRISDLAVAVEREGVPL